MLPSVKAWQSMHYPEADKAKQSKGKACIILRLTIFTFYCLSTHQSNYKFQIKTADQFNIQFKSLTVLKWALAVRQNCFFQMFYTVGSVVNCDPVETLSITSKQVQNLSKFANKNKSSGIF